MSGSKRRKNTLKACAFLSLLHAAVCYQCQAQSSSLSSLVFASVFLLPHLWSDDLIWWCRQEADGVHPPSRPFRQRSLERVSNECARVIFPHCYAELCITPFMHAWSQQDPVWCTEKCQPFVFQILIKSKAVCIAHTRNQKVSAQTQDCLYWKACSSHDKSMCSLFQTTLLAGVAVSLMGIPVNFKLIGITALIASCSLRLIGPTAWLDYSISQVWSPVFLLPLPSL